MYMIICIYIYIYIYWVSRTLDAAAHSGLTLKGQAPPGQGVRPLRLFSILGFGACWILLEANLIMRGEILTFEGTPPNSPASNDLGMGEIFAWESAVRGSQPPFPAGQSLPKHDSRGARRGDNAADP